MAHLSQQILQMFKSCTGAVWPCCVGSVEQGSPNITKDGRSDRTVSQIVDHKLLAGMSVSLVGWSQVADSFSAKSWVYIRLAILSSFILPISAFNKLGPLLSLLWEHESPYSPYLPSYLIPKCLWQSKRSAASDQYTTSLTNELVGDITWPRHQIFGRLEFLCLTCVKPHSTRRMLCIGHSKLCIVWIFVHLRK